MPQVLRSVPKRLADVMVSALLVVVLSPVFVIVGAVVALDDGFPVLFRQARRGLTGRPFTMLKFRTMKRNAPDWRQSDGSTFSGAIDPRLTRTGKLFRETSLDELPQLLNVLLGDMSIVGPRPDLPDQALYDTPQDVARLSVRPGITGLAQVRGRNTASWRDRRRLDRWYARNWSMLLDCMILFETIRVVASRSGVTTRDERPATRGSGN